ncbi:glycosyltransferase, partial [Pedobacter sp. HMWF019]|uniref:glycosyltransferase family 2 protein n=1 Tax=Pedobacter sp. HMWF019 TaxID=2056856 RepID=UPI000D3D94A1
MIFESLGAVVVLYYPDVSLIILNIEKISKQVGNIYIIDNTPDVEYTQIIDFFSESKSVHYLPLKENKGIAEAQNIGIRKVFESEGTQFVLLLDQDSVPDEYMIENLMDSFHLLHKMNEFKISAVGALTINRDTNTVYKDRELKKNYISGHLVKKTEVMSSGSLISRAAINEIGLLESSLFIDGVDHEWCWRGNNMGYTCFINEKALLLHKLGEGDKKIFGLTIAISPPMRCFYQFRNFLILIKRPYVPFNWKLVNFIKYFIKILYYPIFISPR